MGKPTRQRTPNDRKRLIARVAGKFAKTAKYDAENCTSYEEEFSLLATRLAERMSNEELKAALNG